MINITKIRVSAGLSQRELAKRIGLTDSAICQYEQGKRTPNIQTLKRIADVLNCKLEDLI